MCSTLQGQRLLVRIAGKGWRPSDVGENVVKDLGHRLGALGDLGRHPDLSGLEEAVWADVDARAVRQMPTRFAVVLCVLTALIASGVGAAAAAANVQRTALSVFAIHPDNAPSTLLGG